MPIKLILQSPKIESWAVQNGFIVTDLQKPTFQQEAARLSFEMKWWPTEDPRNGTGKEYLGLVLPLFIDSRGMVLTNKDTAASENYLWLGSTALLLYNKGVSPQLSSIWAIAAIFVLSKHGN